jgi:hypothetical protein
MNPSFQRHFLESRSRYKVTKLVIYTENTVPPLLTGCPHVWLPAATPRMLLYHAEKLSLEVRNLTFLYTRRQGLTRSGFERERGTTTPTSDRSILRTAAEQTHWRHAIV